MSKRENEEAHKGKKGGAFHTPWINAKRPRGIRLSELIKIEDEKPAGKTEESSCQLQKVRFIAEGEKLPMQFEIVGFVRDILGDMQQDENCEFSLTVRLGDCSGTLNAIICHNALEKLFNTKMPKSPRKSWPPDLKKELKQKCREGAKIFYDFYGKMCMMRRPAKSAVNFEVRDFIEITDTKVPRQPLIELPEHNVPLNLDYQAPLSENKAPNDSDNLTVITFEPSDPPPDNLPTQEHLDFLKENFGHSQFRDNQWKVISSIIYGRNDQLVIMATGHGKSLCFQYPTLWMNAHVICICPLISLMQDQVQQLNSKGIPACFLGSAQKEKRITLAKIYNRNYRAIYVCPEWIEKNILQLRRIMSKIPVALFAIDEGMFS